MEIRTAQPRDLGQIEKLLTDRGDASDAIDARLLLNDPDAGWEWCAVAVDGDEVVATITLMDETLRLGGVDLPAGQIEQVATHTAYEGRGLMRRLIGWAHERSARRGHVVQLVLGIPYFYRQFGYAYTATIPQTRELATKPEPVAGHTIRAATEADIPELSWLQDLAQSKAGLRLAHTEAVWRFLLNRTGSTTWVVERDGAIVATGRTTPPEEGDVVLGEVAAVDDAAARALVHLTDPDNVVERHPALEEHLAPRDPRIEQYLHRAADLPALFERLRPLFAQRLRDQPHDEVLLSFFRTHVRFTWDGEVGEFRWGGPMQGPYSQGGAGIAPDLVPQLLFGPHGMDGLRRTHPDVYPGPKEELMFALFPPVTSDLLTFYLP